MNDDVDKVDKGIILKCISGKYTVFSAGNSLECTARGIFRKDKITPLPGDEVFIKNNVILSIGERRNVFIRPPVANVDQLAFFVPVKSPDPDLYLVDKMILTARLQNIDVILCINKEDCDEKNYSKELDAIYMGAGVKVVVMSALHKNNRGIDEIRQLFQGKITVLSGQSGAGKSTALNSIFQEEIMETGDISSKTQRGKHTTRHCELFQFGSGFIIDTPGFSSYELPEILSTSLKDLYPEFDNYANGCKYKECVHINEPDCAVKTALSSGFINCGRYERYIRFYEEMLVRARRY